jgi:hypothetical protein
MSAIHEAAKRGDVVALRGVRASINEVDEVIGSACACHTPRILSPLHPHPYPSDQSLFSDRLYQAIIHLIEWLRREGRETPETMHHLLHAKN